MATTKRVRSPLYFRNLFAGLMERMRLNGHVTDDDLDELRKQARSKAGGQARAASGRHAAALADDENEAEDSFEDNISDVREALEAQYGQNVTVIATFSDHVIYGVYPRYGYIPSDYGSDSGGESHFYSQQYTEDANDNIILGERKEVEKNIDWKPAGANTSDDDDDDVEDSYEDQIHDVADALRAQYGSCYTVATYPSYVVYCSYGGDTPHHYKQDYAVGDNDQITFGPRQEVERTESWDEIAANDQILADYGDYIALAYAKKGASGSAKGGKTTLPKNVQKLPDVKQQQWTDIWNSAYERCQKKGGGAKDCEQQAFQRANGVIKRELKALDDEQSSVQLQDFLALANGKTTEKPWDGGASKYKDTAAYCKASLINDNDGASSDWTQAKCHLPVYEPDGTLNLNAVRNAAARINQVKASPKAKAAAYRKLNALKAKHEIGDGDVKGQDLRLVSIAENGSHAPMTGSHTHEHQMYGDGGMHTHKHSHDGTADHHHSHAEVAAEDGGVLDVQLASKQVNGASTPAQTGGSAYVGTGAAASVFSSFAKGLPNEDLRATWVRVYQHHLSDCTARGGMNCHEMAKLMADAHMKSLPTGEATKTDARVLGDSDDMNYTITEIRLGDAATQEPIAWQQIHKLGTWAVPHASGQKVELTREIGDQMIRNFRKGVLRRGVPLDEGHTTDQGGHAIGWVQDIRWGSEGQGLPGQQEPDGDGPILYARFNYNNVGTQKLGDHEFKYLSPQYSFNYQDKETGQEYGYTLTAVAATNNPYLRLRSVQGEPAPEPALILSDGLVRPQQETSMSGAQLTDQVRAQIDAQLQERQRQWEARLQEERKERERLEARLAESEQARHTEAVEAYIAAQISAGLPPAFANVAKLMLMNSSPRAEATLKLSDDDNAAAVNLHEAVKKLCEMAPKIPVDQTLTTQGESDARPGTNRAKLDDEIRQYGRQLLTESNIPLRTNGKNGRQPEGGTATMDD